MRFSEKIIFFFFDCNKLGFSSFLSDSESFQCNFGDFIILATDTSSLYDFLEELKFDDSHDKISVVFDFISETVIVDGICIVSFFVIFEIHINQLKAFRSCKIQLFNEFP